MTKQVFNNRRELLTRKNESKFEKEAEDANLDRIVIRSGNLIFKKSG